MQKEWVKRTENGYMRKIYTVWWEEEDAPISKKTGKPVRKCFQTIDENSAKVVAEARKNEGFKNVEITERWD